MDVLIRWQRVLTRTMQEAARRRATRHALGRAMRHFSHLHPHWYGLRFDEAFLTRLPDGLLGEADATALAREWARQFCYRDARQREREVRQLVPVVESFLALLDEEETASGLREPMTTPVSAETPPTLGTAWLEPGRAVRSSAGPAPR